MANYYTETSTYLLEDLTDEECDWIEVALANIYVMEDDEYEKHMEWLDEHGFVDTGNYWDDGWPNFKWMFDEHPPKKTSLWVRSEESFDPDHVAYLAQAFLARFRPDSWAEMEYSWGCTKPLIDAFGGGAMFVTAKTIEFTTSFSWLFDKRKGFENAR